MGKAATITRRTLLLGSAAVAGGFAIGYWKYKQPYDNPLLPGLGDGEAALTPYVRIDATGVTVITPRAEMGQGVHTTLAALVAEELDLDWEDVRVEHGPASRAYYNGAMLQEAVPFKPTDTRRRAELMRDFMAVPAKFLGLQATGGSSTIPDGYEKMRLAGAAARHVLVEAAARRLGVAPEMLSTSRGAVITADGNRLDYTELALDAAAIEPPRRPRLRPASQWRLLGRALPRVDMLAKCTGTAEFGVDVRLPGMVYATVRKNPRLGGGMNGFDASAAESLPGVLQVMDFEDGVAVVASNTWYAIRAAQAIDIDWGPGSYAASSAGMLESIAGSMTEASQDSRNRDDGDVVGVLERAAAGEVIEAEYRAPFLAHATMEPMNATAWLRDGILDVWAGTQIPTQVVKEAQALTGLPEDAIRVHTPFLGGGFGRRAEMDVARQAIELAQRLEGTPVKLTWTREEDVTHDFYRPAAVARFRATVSQGRPQAVDLHVSTLSVIASQLGRIGINSPGADASIVAGAWEQPYAIANYRVTGYRAPDLYPVGSWRSVGASQNGFFHETMLDELAHAAGADPLAMRLALLDHQPSRKVLEAVAEQSGWGSELPEGHGRGVAYVLSFGVPVAEVIEIAMTENGIRIVGVWAAVDVGTALDPGIIEAQVQSAVNFGLAAAIMGEITIEDGAVQQNNFHQYDAIRIAQAPPIEVRILENGERVRGIGEPGLPPAAPALGNAIFAATGRRLRELPFGKQIRFA